MDEATARKILGAPKGTSFDEVRKRFRRLAKIHHPDVLTSGDATRFILVSTAYLVLQGKELGLQMDRGFSDDVSYAINLKAEIDSFFDSALDEFRTSVERVRARTDTYIKSVISSVDSPGELKEALKTRLAQSLTDASTEIQACLRGLEKKVNSSDSEFLYSLFRDMYESRRRYWLLSLYKNPVTIFETVGLALIFFVQNYPEIGSVYPQAFKLASLWWLPILFILIGIFILALQYMMLNPRRHFLPPRISVGGWQQVLAEFENRIKPSEKTLLLGGAFVGAVFGTAVAPVIGTAMGALLGSLSVFFGENLDKAKKKLYADISRELNEGLRQVTDHVDGWAARSKTDIHNAAVESFRQNCRRVAKLLSNKSLTLKKLTQGEHLHKGQ